MPTQHTPAPWQSHPHPTHAAVIATAAGHSIALILDQGSDEATDARARLIASAPELLAALQMTPLDLHPEDFLGECLCGQCQFRRAARAALAKALPES